MKKSSIFLIIFTIIIFIGVSIFYIYPKSMDLVSMFEEKDELNALIEQTKTEQEKMKDFLSKEEEIRSNFEKISKFLPSKSEIAPFIIQVEGAASATDNELSEIGFPKSKQSTASKQAPSSRERTDEGETSGPETKKLDSKVYAEEREEGTSLSTLDFEIKINGTYFNLIKYLENIENLLRYNQITSFETQTKEGGDILESTIKGKVYYRK